MKRIILLGAFTSLLTFLNLSCSEEQTENSIEYHKNDIEIYQRELQDVNYEKLTFDSDEFLESNEWLRKNSFFGINFNCNELYEVTSKLDNKSYVGLDIDIQNCYIEGYRIKNYVVFHELSNGKKFIYLQRDIIKNNTQIVQFLDINNGEVMDYYLYNCSEDDYALYQSKLNETVGGLGLRHICYKSFKSCYNNTKAGLVQSAADEVLCEWLPCATMAYSFCALAYVDGYIATAGGFNPGDCTKII